MKKKSLIYSLISLMIIVSNILMMTIVNTGEETFSNILIILITIIIFPMFQYALKNDLTHLIRVESFGFLFFAALSFMRLINRIEPQADIAIGAVTIPAIGISIFMTAIIVVRLTKK